MRPRSLAVAVGLALSAPLHPSLVLATPAPEPDAAVLDAVVVVATRSESLVGDAPATVSVVPSVYWSVW